MDGNFGLMAAVVELVVQSQGEVIRVLPALPDQWPEGSCRRVRARGGLAVDLAWSHGRLTTLTVHRLHGADGPVHVEYRGRRCQVLVARGSSVDLGAELEVLC
jgi:alpha-L-fucosidase 2